MNLSYIDLGINIPLSWEYFSGWVNLVKVKKSFLMNLEHINNKLFW